MNDVALPEQQLRELVNTKKKYVYGTSRPCQQCGVVFRPKDKNSIAKYCSYACNNRSRTVHKPRPCAVCGNEFRPTRIGWNCCSRSCGTAYRLSRHQQDPLTLVRKKLSVFCCGLISRCLRGKIDSTKNTLGYSSDDLRSHLEGLFTDGMTWNNYGKRLDQWSIDHIRPISSFPESATVREINALINLQPLWHRENCRKRNRWNQ